MIPAQQETVRIEYPDGLRNDLYGLILFRFRKNNMTEMSDDELKELCSVVKGFVPASTLKVNMTIKQYKKIMMQMKDLGWTMDTFSSFIKRRNMVKNWDGKIESIWPYEARFIITALEKMRCSR